MSARQASKRARFSKRRRIERVVAHLVVEAFRRRHPGAIEFWQALGYIDPRRPAA